VYPKNPFIFIKILFLRVKQKLITRGRQRLGSVMKPEFLVFNLRQNCNLAGYTSEKQFFTNKNFCNELVFSKVDF